jgi:hypothetical protein
VIAGEASGRSVGHVFSLGALPASLSITVLAEKLWEGLNSELQCDTGELSGTARF